jgi:DNA-binding MarR family transcriptional regulator
MANDGIERRLTDAISVAGIAGSEDLAYRLAATGFDDLRASDWPILRLVLRRGPLSMGALSEALGVTKQATGKAVSDLSRREYVIRVGHAGDKRRKRVELAPRAFAALEAEEQWAAEHEARAVERWGADDVRRTIAILVRFAEDGQRFPGVGRDLRSGR